MPGCQPYPVRCEDPEQQLSASGLYLALHVLACKSGLWSIAKFTLRMSDEISSTVPPLDTLF